MTRKIHIIGGGTFAYVRNHLALAAPAFGRTARTLGNMIRKYGPAEDHIILHLTQMAGGGNFLVTNDDVSALLDTLIADPETRVIILNAALCDYDGSILEDTGLGSTWHPDMARTPSGSHAPRLKTSAGEQTMILTPAEKLIGKIRRQRKDIFVVGFKTTTNATPTEQYRVALDMLKANSLNLVLANDTVTRNNIVVAPEETRYFESTNREASLTGLAKMIISRSQNTFTRSTVVPGDPVAWGSDLIPDNLRTVVDHCIARGAYKPFRGVTAGHFAVKLDEGRILTSKRKRDFNKLSEEGLVLVEYENDDRVIAHGAKPSVGGQSQRIVFREHPELDCIVHAHVPLREDHDPAIPLAPQWQNECGSHQCGANTSRNLAPIGRDDIQVVMLDDHGPNIVFARTTPAEEVIAFIERNFDLEGKTGGLVA